MKEKVIVTGVPETMIQTLYARAKESEKDNPMIQDDMAAEIVSKLDYDFSNADKDKAMSYGVIARTIVLDEMVGRHLSKNPNTVVINIASGMDTRCYRMKGKYLRWYNVDLPETMEIREKFLTENGPIYQIAKSAMDASYMDEIVCDGENVLVVIEGLSMYLQEKDIREILNCFTNRFKGATFLIETMNPIVVRNFGEKSIEGSNAKFTWGIKNGAALEKYNNNIKCLEDHSLVEGMEKMMPIYKVIGKIPFIRNLSNRIIVLSIQ